MTVVPVAMMRPPMGACAVDELGGVLADVVALGVHVVILDVFGFDRAEGADTDVQGEEGVLDLGKDFWGEMQAGGGRSNGTLLACEGCLVAIAVLWITLAVHVMWQG